MSLRVAVHTRTAVVVRRRLHAIDADVLQLHARRDQRRHFVVWDTQDSLEAKPPTHEHTKRSLDHMPMRAVDPVERVFVLSQATVARFWPRREQPRLVRIGAVTSDVEIAVKAVSLESAEEGTPFEGNRVVDTAWRVAVGPHEPALGIDHALKRDAEALVSPAKEALRGAVCAPGRLADAHDETVDGSDTATIDMPCACTPAGRKIVLENTECIYVVAREVHLVIEASVDGADNAPNTVVKRGPTHSTIRTAHRASEPEKPSRV